MGRDHVSSYRFPFASYPALRIALLLSWGILLGRMTAIGYAETAILFGGICAAWFCFEFIFVRVKPVLSVAVATLLYSLTVCAAGVLLHAFQNESRMKAQTAENVLSLYEGEEIEIKARVLEIRKQNSGRTTLVVESAETRFERGPVWGKSYKARVYSNQTMSLAAGDSVALTVRVVSFPERRNPHEFDYAEWLRRERVSMHGEVQHVQKLNTGSSGVWVQLRNQVKDNVERQFSESHIPLAKALFLGMKQDLDSEIRSRFSRSGLSHIMAVSGLHVGFIVAPFWLLIPFFWGSRFGKISGLIILTALLTGYAGLTGFTASVCRASLMAWLLTFAKLFHKTRNSVNLTSAAAIILLIADPEQLFEAGFQLSFAAVYIILLVMPEVLRMLPARVRFGRLAPLISIVSISIVVQVGLYPVLISYFGEFSIMGPLANALVVPVLSVTVPAGLLISVTGIFDVKGFSMAAEAVEFLLDWIQWVATAIGQQDRKSVV